jgi:hypothetical protein
LLSGQIVSRRREGESMIAKLEIRGSKLANPDPEDCDYSIIARVVQRLLRKRYRFATMVSGN